MKKILYILMIGLLASCDSLLDVEPETLVSFNNFYKTEEDLEATLYQLADFMGREGVAGAGTQATMGRITEWTADLEHTWEPINVVGSSGIVASKNCDWAETYYIIYMANVLLDNMSNAKANVTSERMDFYRAQAYFCKAWAYFYLGREWGEVPITRNSYSNEVYAKKPILEVLDTVISNATRAYNMLPVHSALVNRLGVPITSKQFGSKGTACALLAHVYAWKGSVIDLMGLEGDSKECYNKSIEYASRLIKGEVGNYSLVRDPEKLCQIFSNNEMSNPEAIFEYSLDTQNDYIASTYLFGMSYVGYPIRPGVAEGDQQRRDPKIAYTTIRALYDTLDLRRDAYFYRYSYYSTDTVNLMFTGKEYTEAQRLYKRDSVRTRINQLTGGIAYPFKWRVGMYKSDPYSPTGIKLIAMKSNYAYLRLSEIYLLRAECYVKIGENDLAEGDLNEIRSCNNVKKFPNSGGDEKGLKYAVFHERERELLMEGHRFYDIVRNGMEYINTYLPGAFKTLTISDVKSGALFYPIHESAFEKNAILRQNVYWAQYLN